MRHCYCQPGLNGKKQDKTWRKGEKQEVKKLFAAANQIGTHGCGFRGFLQGSGTLNYLYDMDNISKGLNE